MRMNTNSHINTITNVLFVTICESEILACGLSVVWNLIKLLGLFEHNANTMSVNFHVYYTDRFNEF